MLCVDGVLQQEGKAAKERTDQPQHAKGLTSIERSSLDVHRAPRRGPTRACCRSAKARINGLTGGVGGGPGWQTCRARRRLRRADGAGVGSYGMLRTAGMLRAAITCTGIVVPAVGDALGAPLLTDKVRKGLSVLADVGTKAVAAHAGVGKSRGVAGV